LLKSTTIILEHRERVLYCLKSKLSKSIKGLQKWPRADNKRCYLPGNLLVFLFQNDFLGLPDSPEKVTIVGSSALECSIELNWVPRAITRSFAASLIFTVNLDQPPITNQLTKNCFSLKVTKAKEKGPISWY